MAWTIAVPVAAQHGWLMRISIIRTQGARRSYPGSTRVLETVDVGSNRQRGRRLPPAGLLHQVGAAFVPPRRWQSKAPTIRPREGRRQGAGSSSMPASSGSSSHVLTKSNRYRAHRGRQVHPAAEEHHNSCLFSDPMDPPNRIEEEGMAVPATVLHEGLCETGRVHAHHKHCPAILRSSMNLGEQEGVDGVIYAPVAPKTDGRGRRRHASVPAPAGQGSPACLLAFASDQVDVPTFLRAPRGRRRGPSWSRPVVPYYGGHGAEATITIVIRGIGVD